MTLDRSHELCERAKRSLAGGVSSQVRLREQPVPMLFERGSGSRLITRSRMRRQAARDRRAHPLPARTR